MAARLGCGAGGVMTTEQELDEYMKARLDEDRAKVQDAEAAIRWLCRRLDEMKEENSRQLDRLRLAAEGDQLRARVAGLEASNHRQGIELSEAREANEALAFDRAKQVNHYNGGLRYRRLSDELIIRDDGYRIEYQLADARNVKPSDWELWAEYKQSNYTGSEIADALMGHKETP